MATTGLPIALCVILATTGAACGTQATSSQAGLATTCRRPYDSLSPSESIDCVAAGYYRTEVKNAQRADRLNQFTHTGPQRRTLVLGKGQRSVTVLEHPQGDTVVFDTPHPEDLTIRPGTCGRSSRGRGYHLGYTGEAAFTFSRLRRASFAVEFNSPDGSVIGCVDHRGVADLTTNVARADVRVRARRVGTALVYTNSALKVRLTPAAGGTKTQIVVSTGAPGNGDEHVHLRRGTCDGIPSGREWPLYLANDGLGTEHAEGTFELPIPFSQIVRTPWVYEEHALVGDVVYTCVQF